jgi:hypothetical protein
VKWRLSSTVDLEEAGFIAWQNIIMERLLYLVYVNIVLVLFVSVLLAALALGLVGARCFR